MTQQIILAPSLDTAAAAPLATQLRDLVAAGSDIRLDGSAVGRAGQACLQVLMSTRIGAAQAGTGFVIDAPSDNLVASAKLLGLDSLVQSAG